MVSRILALKGRTQDAVSAIKAVLRKYGDQYGHYDLLEIPDAGHTLLRLNHVDAVIVLRDDFGHEPPELAEVFAWIRAVLQRQEESRRPVVPIGVSPCQKHRDDCTISALSRRQNSCKERPADCLARVIVLCNQAQRGVSPRRRYDDENALAEAYARAVEAGWTTPDGTIGPDHKLKATRKGVLFEWIQNHPALAWASAADALGWLAYQAASATSAGKFDDVRLLSDAEHVIIRALAWALEETSAAHERYRLMAACTQRRVAIVWGGHDGRQFRLALRALLFEERLGDDTAASDPSVPAWQKEHPDLIDLAQQRGTPGTPRAADDSALMSPIPNVRREQIETVLGYKWPIVPLNVAKEDIDAVLDAAPKFDRDCIVLNEGDLGDLLEGIATAALHFTNRIGRA